MQWIQTFSSVSLCADQSLAAVCVHLWIMNSGCAHFKRQCFSHPAETEILLSLIAPSNLLTSTANKAALSVCNTCVWWWLKSVVLLTSSLSSVSTWCSLINTKWMYLVVFLDITLALTNYLKLYQTTCILILIRYVSETLSLLQGLVHIWGWQ